MLQMSYWSRCFLKRNFKVYISTMHAYECSFFLIPIAVLRLLLHHPVPWALSRMSHKVEPGLNAYSDAATGELSPQAESKYVNAFESAEELARF